ncbi:hypothetical protein TW85_24485 [Marinomonas sp. S3726]|nr:hypothetical protein TW85_24485 [Marinomonas sp. S3726]
MILSKHIRLTISLLMALALTSPKAETLLPNLEANLDEQSLSNPSYVLGQHWFRKLHGSKHFINFPPAYDYLRSALAQLLPYTELYQKNIEIGLLNSTKSNAFVLPGSHMFLYSDMLSKINDEQTLLALLAHELAHLDLKHYERQSQHSEQEKNKAMLMMGAGIVAALAGAQGDASSALFLSGIANQQENRLSYSRIQEVEADRQAKKYLIRAGIDEHATSKLFFTFFQGTIGREPIEFLSTHPIPENRLADSLSTTPIQSILKQGDQTQFNQFRATLLAYRASLMLNPDTYIQSQINIESDQVYAKALVALINNDKEKANSLAKKLNVTLYNQAYLKARILINSGKIEEAQAIIQHKLSLNKNQLAFIELSPDSHLLSSTQSQQVRLLQYEKDIINRIHLRQAKEAKNLALTRAYEAKIVFSKGQGKSALNLLKRAEFVADNNDLIIINKIKEEIFSTIELEKGNKIELD